MEEYRPGYYPHTVYDETTGQAAYVTYPDHAEEYRPGYYPRPHTEYDCTDPGNPAWGDCAWGVRAGYPLDPAS